MEGRLIPEYPQRFGWMDGPVRSSNVTRSVLHSLVYLDVVQTLRHIHPTPGSRNNRYLFFIDISTHFVSWGAMTYTERLDRDFTFPVKIWCLISSLYTV